MTTLDTAILAHLLGDAPALHPSTDVHAFFAAHHAATAPVPHPIDRALLGGFHADRLGFAFVAGYRAALGALVPSLAGHEVAALCATEKGGNTPKAIETTFEGGRLNGHKTWTTLGSAASSLLVVAKTGVDAQGRNRLAVVHVPVARAGVTVKDMPELPFVPEIPHCEVSFERVSIEEHEVLPGDGYERYLKPFRTIEDLHVHAAAVGHLVSVARRFGFPHEPLEELASLAITLRTLADAPPLDPTLHVALAGLFTHARGTLERLEPHWARTDEATRSRWQRDRALLSVAGKAREARRLSAWQRLAT